MPYRRIVFGNGEIYHVVNRGVADMPIVYSPKDYKRFLALADFYRYDTSPLSFSHYSRLNPEEQSSFLEKVRSTRAPIVEIIAYCVMTNHFHLILKQNGTGGIQKYLANLQNSYVKFINLSHIRKGTLFQSAFKALRVETEEQLLHTNRYVHLNPSTAYIVEPENLTSYAWSSLPDYFGERTKPLVEISKNLVLSLVGGYAKYKSFVLDQADYQRELDKIKHLTLENT